MFAATVLDNVVKIVEALAWPVAVVVAAFLLRRQIGELGRGIAGRASSVSVSGFGASLSVSFADKVGPEQTRAVQDDLPVASAGAAGASGVGALAAFLTQAAAPSACAVVDLGSGGSWLTTRLYLLAVLAPRQRGVRQFVFVRADAYPDVFHSYATPAAVEAALVRDDPELEAAYARALSSAYRRAGFPQAEPDAATSLLPSYVPPPPAAVDALGPIGPHAEFLSAITIQHLVQSFVHALQWSGAAEPPQTGSWIQRTEPGADVPAPVYERARWVDPVWLAGILGDDCHTDAVRRTGGESNEDVVKQVLAIPAPHVAIVDGAGRFQELVDRERLVAQMGGSAAPAQG